MLELISDFAVQFQIEKQRGNGMPVGQSGQIALAAPTQTLEKALVLLDFFKAAPSLSHTELARLSGLNKSTLHRLLRTLEAIGYLARDPDTGRYALGLKLFELGALAVTRLPVRRQALPVMKQLSFATGESVFLGIPLEGASVCVEEVVTAHAVWLGTAIGMRSPLHATASGKCFLASLPALREAFLARGEPSAITARTLTSAAALEADLRAVAARGWAVNDEETEPGVRYLAAPVRDGSGQVIAALALGAAVDRLPVEAWPAMAQRVLAATREISVQLGHHLSLVG
jgi:DNA-binding IclR family transcriptional regulator